MTKFHLRGKKLNPKGEGVRISIHCEGGINILTTKKKKGGEIEKKKIIKGGVWRAPANKRKKRGNIVPLKKGG